ncbi:MAG: Pyridoxine 5'-phosphate synthase [Candidatus Kapaibacterium sp.]|nr:MAG: Pyridoxine 5'-phosphate synthase [Candidatus Kapabacteria bacterium]
MVTLNVNVDHIATLRQARGGNEPDPVAAAVICELAGANGIVCHLREDRRHIQDRDVELLRQVVSTKLDLEMAAVEEIINIALRIKPDLVTIVPEKRMELTTEGGLDVAKDIPRFKELVARMHQSGIEVSFFIEPELKQIDAVLETGAEIVELHTGVYSNLRDIKQIKLELERLKKAADYAKNSGLRVVAGHGLNYRNVFDICLISSIEELSIGHSIISRAAFVGLERAVREMIDAINYAVLSR